MSPQQWTYANSTRMVFQKRSGASIKGCHLTDSPFGIKVSASSKQTKLDSTSLAPKTLRDLNTSLIRAPMFLVEAGYKLVQAHDDSATLSVCQHLFKGSFFSQLLKSLTITIFSHLILDFHLCES